MYAIVTPARVWNLAALGPGRPVSVSTRARRAKRAGFSPFAIARTAISTSTSPNKYKKRWAMSGAPEAETAKKAAKTEQTQIPELTEFSYLWCRFEFVLVHRWYNLVVAPSLGKLGHTWAKPKNDRKFVLQ